MCKFKVGDKVEVVDANGGWDYEEGEICEVKEVTKAETYTLITCKDKEHGMYDFRFKLVEEVKFDIKSIIKPLMRVVIRNGRMFIAVDSGEDKSGLILVDPTEENSWNRIRNNEDGFDPDFDIISVYDVPKYEGELLNIKKYGNLVWSAKTPKQLKIEALEKELAELKASNKEK